MEKFCEIFPVGFPNEEELHKIWNGQKVKKANNGSGSDNLLDYQSAMVSIHFMKPAV